MVELAAHSKKIHKSKDKEESEKKNTSAFLQNRKNKMYLTIQEYIAEQVWQKCKLNIDAFGHSGPESQD